MRVILPLLIVAVAAVATYSYRAWRQRRVQRHLMDQAGIVRDEAIADLEASLAADDITPYLRPERRAVIEDLLRRMRRL